MEPYLDFSVQFRLHKIVGKMDFGNGGEIWRRWGKARFRLEKFMQDRLHATDTNPPFFLHKICGFIERQDLCGQRLHCVFPLNINEIP